MKIIYIAFALILFHPIQAQNKYPVFEALAKADLAALSNLLDDRVEICFDSKVQYLDKQATLNSIRNFLTQNPPKSCTPIHNGTAKGNASNYIIGTLVSTNGKNFRVFAFSSDRNDRKVIQELKIDLQ